jgi:hypothetical protein
MTVDPLAIAAAAPPATMTAGSSSFGETTPEPYLGYVEPQTGFEVDLCDAQATHGEVIYDHHEPPVTWNPVRRPSVLVDMISSPQQILHDHAPPIIHSLGYAHGQVVEVSASDLPVQHRP